MRRAAFLLAAVFVAACSSPQTAPPPAPSAEAVHFEQCGDLARGASKLPDVALPCFTGGDMVRLGLLRGPLVVNLWASWCGPCRKELPAFQRLASSGKLPVITVATDDRREASLSLAQDLGVRVPTFFDPGGELRRVLGEAALPLTIFVDGQGNITTYSGPALTDATLTDLVRERIGDL